MSFARPTTMTNAQAVAAQGSTMSAIYQHGFMPASSLQPSSLMKTVSRQSSMNSSFMGEHPDAKNVEKLIASKLRTQQMAHEQLIMYAKNSAIADALIYVKNKCHEIEELLTSQKTDIIIKYEAFQKHNINLLKENHIIHEKWKAAEFASIYINPLSEYNYGVDKNTPLKKFNYITPSIGEHLKILADQKQKEYNEKLKKENTALRAANEQLQEQLDTLVFWEDIMEQGVDARDLIVEFGNLQNEHRKLLNTSGQTIKQLERDLAIKTRQYDETFAKLKAQQETVVRPLVSQVTRRQERIDEQVECNLKLQESLNKLYQIIRSPQLVNLFHKAERERKS